VDGFDVLDRLFEAAEAQELLSTEIPILRIRLL
jgi:hypothetical protein